MSKKFKTHFMKRSKKVFIVIFSTIVIAGTMTGIVTYGRSNVLYKGVGTVTEKKQEGDEFFTTVVSGNVEQTFEGEAIYDSFEEQDEVEVFLLKKKIFDLIYETEMGLTGSKK